jgi:hypothetical protein
MNLDQLDALRPTPLSTEIERRRSDPVPLRPVPDPPRAARRLTAGAVAVTVFALAAGLGLRAIRDEAVDEPTPAPSPDVWTGLPTGLTQLPDQPLQGEGIARAYGGGYLLLWGGHERDGLPSRNEGFVFDVEARSWRAVAPSPLSGHSSAVAVWTGEEFLVWGGGIAGRDWPPEPVAEGAAYNPEADTWRTIPPAPVASDPFPRAVWTGEEMIVLWQEWTPGESAGLAYDVANSSWRELPDPQVRLGDIEGIWTGEEVVVLGAPPDSEPYPRYAASLALDDAAWKALPETELIANSTELAWDGTRVVAMDYNNDVRALDDASGTWIALPSLPANQCEGGLSTPAVHDGTIVLATCGELLALEPGAERWRVLVGRGEPGPGINYGPVFAAEGAFLVEGWERNRDTLLVYRDPGPTPTRAAWDVAAYFGALRSHYPYEPDQVPEDVLNQVERLLSPTALSRYEDRAASGLTPLWTYYWSYETISVEGGSAPFEVVIELHRGQNARERLIIGPGVGLDGEEHELVILDVGPA